MNSLSRLEEGAGIKIVTSLAEIPAQLAAVLGVRLMAGEEQQVEIVIGKWESGQNQHPITWRSLLDTLKELDLEDLSQEIEDYMHGEQGMCVPVYLYRQYIFIACESCFCVHVCCELCGHLCRDLFVVRCLKLIKLYI